MDGVHQILAHGSEVRIDDPVHDAAAADLLEFVNRQFADFVVQLGHACLLFRVGRTIPADREQEYAGPIAAAVTRITIGDSLTGGTESRTAAAQALKQTLLRVVSGFDALYLAHAHFRKADKAAGRDNQLMICLGAGLIRAA